MGRWRALAFQQSRPDVVSSATCSCDFDRCARRKRSRDNVMEVVHMARVTRGLTVCTVMSTMAAMGSHAMN